MAGKGIIDTLTNPDVAIAEGVPAILGLTSGSMASGADYAALVASTAEEAAISALQSWADGLTGYAWGLFDQSGNSLFPDALVLQIGGNTPRIVSNAPVQNGSFTSYNKVANPEQIQIGLSFQGSISDKTEYFADLETLLNGTDLVTVRMPETTRLNMTVVNISYMRNARSGADLFMPVVTLQEIRVYAQTTTTTKDGTTPTTQNMGSTQASVPTAAQNTAINS